MNFKFILDLQYFASKKGTGSVKNGRDSAGRRLGIKLYDGEVANSGSILYRQRGTKIIPGINVKQGKDDTLFSVKNGTVKYDSFKGKTRVNVISIEK